MLKDFLAWLERVLPGWLAAFGIGYKIGENGKEEAKKQTLKAELDLALKENELEIEKRFANKSDDDIIKFIISNGSGDGHKKPDSDGKT